jgi:hypothetical protein
MAVRFGNSGIQLYSVSSGLPSGDFTLLMWVSLFATNGSNYQTLLHFISSPEMSVEVNPGTSNMWFGVDPNDGPTFTMTVGAWHCIVLTRTGTSHVMRHGTDPVSLTTLSGLTGTAATPSTLNIGAYDSSSEVFNGRVANFKLYNTALTSAEMTQELSQYTPQRTTNLTHWYPFVNPDTSDYSGNGRTLTATGSGHLVADGPPVRWGRPRPRRVNLAGIPADPIALTVSALQGLGGIQVYAECADIVATAYDSTTLLTAAAESAPVALTAQQGLGGIGAASELIDYTFTAQGATQGTPTNPSASAATLTVSAQDAAVSVAVSPDCPLISIETISAVSSAANTYAAAGVATVSVTAQDVRPTVGGGAEAAPIAVSALDASRGISGSSAAMQATAEMAALDAYASITDQTGGSKRIVIPRTIFVVRRDYRRA